MSVPVFPYLFADPPARETGGWRSQSRDRDVPRSKLSADVSDTAVADLALVRRMAQGDEKALRELYDQTYARLWDFARALGGAREEADEVVQDAYTLLWERAATWDAQSHVRGFLYVTVKNLVRNATRRLRTATAGETQHAPEIVAESMAADPASPDLDAEYRELVHAVLQAIAELPNPRRMALVLRWREQLPYEEIARVLGTSPAVARQLVTRARGMLRARIGHLFEG